MRPLFNPRYPLYLLVIFLIWAGLWAIKPTDIKDWALENALTVLGLLLLIWMHRYVPLTNISYTLIFIFLCLHTVGAHYTYAMVPYNEWTKAIFGRSLNDLLGFERNHYDRLVHFCFGLFMVYPIRELFMRFAGAKGFWSYYLPLDLTMSFSMLYELIEWGAAEMFGGELGTAYLGTQGDQWDAQKDMLLATLGALISLLVVAWINWKFDKNFGAELRQSLTPKPVVLGEQKLSELMGQK